MTTGDRQPRSDKGKKRQYDSTRRKQKKLVNDMARQIEAIDRFEQPRPEGRPCHVRRQDARLKLVPADRICPTCGEPVPELRRWALKNGPVQCISCRRTALNAKRNPSIEVAPASTGEEVIKQQAETLDP